ncbi:hypothetical protein Mapa_009218 [Marchantia paleacea]|nr:hypothetical protein Mapa_009218 [Marchantia paleacea]
MVDSKDLAFSAASPTSQFTTIFFKYGTSMVLVYLNSSFKADTTFSKGVVVLQVGGDT